jgi:futalosine hydrolase
MSRTVLITTATNREMEALDKLPARMPEKISTLVTGIGPVATVYAIMTYLASNGKPDLVINIGIAGSYSEHLQPGSVVVPLSDRFADLGVASGRKFIPISRSGIDLGDNYTPSGEYYADRDLAGRISPDISPVRAVTVSTVTGSSEVRSMISAEFKADIESMEGAAAYYVCNMEKIPCVGLRAVSNMVGPRDRSSWKVEMALERLSEALDMNFNYLVNENT